MSHETQLLTRRIAENTLLMERHFAAAPKRVFQAFTDADIIPGWMSTPSYPMTSCTIDATEGGQFRYVWAGPKGEMAVSGSFSRIEAPHRLEHTEVFDDDWTDGPAHIITEFIETARGTLVRMTLTYRSGKAVDAVLDQGMDRGMDDNYLNLDDVLAGRKALLAVDPELDLVLERVVPVSPDKVYAAWTDPELIVQWFTPAPWSTASANVRPVPGGPFNVTMRSPEGDEMPNTGCVLAAIPNRLLVTTDAMTEGFRPTGSVFLVTILSLHPHPEGTRYIAIARHKNAEDCKKHDEMGFQHGWGAALDQLVALMKDG